MKALILAGGFGTRLKDEVKNVPKPMASILGKRFLEYQINSLMQYDVKDIILAVHYMANKIKSYFGNGSRFGVKITYSEEKTPLGTAGAIKNAEKFIDGSFLVLNGDSYSDMDLRRFLEFHKANGSGCTIGLIKSKNPLHYGNVIMDGSRIKRFSEKENLSEERLVNMGAYLFEPAVLDFIEPNKKVSLEEEIFPRLSEKGRLYGYAHEGYFIDIGRPETYRQFKKDMLETLVFMNEGSEVKEASHNIDKSGIDLILVNDDERRFSGVLNRKHINRYLTDVGGKNDALKNAMIPARDAKVGKTTDSEEKINEILLNEINNFLPIIDKEERVVDVRSREEEIKEEAYPIIMGKAPLRISFAGGGTDVTHFFERYGGVIISCTIDKHCHATIEKRADSNIVLSNPDMIKDEVIIDSYKDIRYDGKFDLIKSAIKVVKPEFGFNLEMRNDIPPGRGLGSSASLAVLVIKLLCELQGKKYDDYAIAELAYKAEREELGIRGGWQDFYAGLMGGFNFMEFEKDRKIAHPLRVNDDIRYKLNEHLLLCYVGKEHSSGELHKKQEESFLEREEQVSSNLNELKRIAIDIKDCLLTGKIRRIGELLHKSWENKRKVDKNISSPRIDQLYETGLDNGALGGKLLGAGGGGYLLFFHSPERRSELTNALKQAGGEILDFNFESEGTTTLPADDI